jgi:hypothetical protein
MANQIGSLQKSNIELVRHRQLINMKQNNKYPQFKFVNDTQFFFKFQSSQLYTCSFTIGHLVVVNSMDKSATMISSNNGLINVPFLLHL